MVVKLENSFSCDRFFCCQMELTVPFTSYKYLRFLALVAGLLGLVRIEKSVHTQDLIQIFKNLVNFSSSVNSLPLTSSHKNVIIDLISVLIADYARP